jgi:ubiquitin carboxyl-terminal hydrolase 4/11/15
LDTFVEFPIEGLNLSNYIINKDLNEDRDAYLYDLFAVSNHFGGMAGGHYIAYAKNIHDKCWYKFDDSTVTKISDKEVVSKDAYVLFYRKRNSKLSLEELYKKPFINLEKSEYASNNPSTN